MAVLANFPLVSQRSTVTSDGRPSENALYDCVPASIGAVMLWLEGKSAWDSTINPDKLKDAAYGDVYTGGTSASVYVDVVKSMGFALAPNDQPDATNTIGEARNLLVMNKPAIFTELDPYVDTSLPQYQGWTHVCVFVGADSSGLTAMDPFIAQLVYKSDATWANLLRANQLWIVEKLPMSTVPANWSDDGRTLKSPNGVPVVLGFRDWILAHGWDKDNWPLDKEQGMTQLEGSNKALGGGTQQLFRWAMLGYTSERGVFVEWVGVELAYQRQQYAALYAAYQKLGTIQQQPAPAPQDPRISQYAAKLRAVNMLASQIVAQAVP